MSTNKALVIAVDFDGTLVEDRFPEIGEPNMDIINTLKTLVDINPDIKLILWTCRNGEHLAPAVAFCQALGLKFAAINENLPEVRALYGGGDTRKVMADIYLDDKAAHPTDWLTSFKRMVENAVQVAESMQETPE